MEMREIYPEMEFGQWLVTMRQSLGLTQRQVGGLPAGTIAAYESGRRKPRSLDHAARLARGLRVPLCVVYQRMSKGQARSRLEGLLAQGHWQEAYITVKTRQWAAQNRADTKELIATEALLGTLAQRMGEDDTLRPLIANPQEALNAAGWALRNSQLMGALVLLRPLETSLPPVGRLYQRLLNNFFYAHRSLGDDAMARYWAGRYIAWAEAEGDRWRAVLAHALWLEAGGGVGVTPEEAAPHVAVLAAWRTVDTGERDPGVLAWELDARARSALMVGRVAEAERYVRQLGEILVDHPLWYTEHLRLTDLSARVQAAQGRQGEAIECLRITLSSPESQSLPRWQRLEVSHTLARLLTDTNPSEAVGVWRQIIQMHWTLEAHPWIDRLFPEWAAVDPWAARDVAPVLLPSSP